MTEPQTITIGTEKYRIIQCVGIGHVTEDRVMLVEETAVMIGCNWAIRQEVAGVIYRMPQPLISYEELVSEMKRLRHKLAEHQGFFASEISRTFGKIGYRALALLIESGFKRTVVVMSYPQEEIRLLNMSEIAI